MATSNSGEKPTKAAAKPAKTAAKTTKPTRTAAKPAAAPAKKTAGAAKPAAKPARKSTAKAAAGATVPIEIRHSAVAPSPEQRRYYVEVAAYYIAERRGFHGGSELNDWVQAEREIDRLLQEGILKP